MIRGLGCDLCAIPRMEKNLENARFLQRWFAQGEREYILDRVNMAQTAAGIFAAKEAFVKALGTGFAALSPENVEISHDENGAPQYLVNEKMRAAMRARGATDAYLSISHDGDYAMAMTILEGN